MKSISWNTATHMMNIVIFTVLQSAMMEGASINVDDLEGFSRDMFMAYCSAEGITEVEEPENDDEY